MPHIVLAGYLGCGNLGDDAVMLGVIEGLGDGFDSTVLAGNPSETNRLYGLRAVDRRSMRAVELAIEASDALVFPGGSVFQDRTSVRSVGYYAAVVRKAKAKGKKVIFLGQGVGPLGTFFGKRMTAAAFNNADYVAVRDSDSGALLRSIGVKTTIGAGADSALLLNVPRASGERNFGIGGMSALAIAPRPSRMKGFDAAEFFAEFCRLVYAAGSVPTLVEMDPAKDGPLIEAISKAQGGRIPALRKIGNPITLVERLTRFDAMVAMRLHAGILSTLASVPPLMLSYDPKVAAFARELRGPAAIPLERCTPARLFEAYNNYMRDLPRLKGEVAAHRDRLRKAAADSVGAARELLLR